MFSKRILEEVVEGVGWMGEGFLKSNNSDDDCNNTEGENEHMRDSGIKIMFRNRRCFY